MKIGIIGIGRLGMCMAITLRNAGHEVIGVDNNLKLIKSLSDGTYYSSEPGVQQELLNLNNITFTSDINDVLSDDIELLYTFVSTPSKPDGSFNHDSIEEIISKLEKKGVRRKKVNFIIGSTVMPGYSDSVSNRLNELNYSIVYNPEFIAQGSILSDLSRPDQVLIGESNKESGDLVESVYKSFLKNEPVFCRMSLVSAELTKLATNCFLTTKISFANAIGDLAKGLGANPEDVLKAIGSDSRIGNKYLKYGFGFGGPCFPRDNQALISVAKNVNMPLHIAEATIKVNNDHLLFQLNEHLEKSSEEYIFDYVSYKPGTDILEESQQLKLAVKLVENGKKVVILNSELVKNQLEDLYPGYFSFQ